MFYITQSATSFNTHKSIETILDIEIRPGSNTRSDKLYITSASGCYMLDTRWHDEHASYELKKDLLSINDQCSITVWGHIIRSIFDIKGNPIFVYQIVDIRTQNKVYWAIEDHNSFQLSERIIGIVMGFVISGIIGIYVFILILGIRNVPRGRFARRQETRERFCVNPSKKLR